MQTVPRYLSIVLILCASLALGCASTSTQEGMGEYVDNSVITGKVKAAIAEDSTLRVTEINVETYKGVVQLSGFADTQTDINRAGALARGIEGVKSVTNDMKLK